METAIYALLDNLSVPVVPVGPVPEDRTDPVAAYRRTGSDYTRQVNDGAVIFQAHEFDITLDTFTYAELETVKAEIIAALDQQTQDGWRFTLMFDNVNQESFETVLSFLGVKG